MKQFIKAVLKFLYRVSGLKTVVSMVESFVLRYRLRVRMVPTSFKVFIFALGVVSGVTGTYVSLSYESVMAPQILTFENAARIQTVEAKEVKELTIEEKIAKTFPENPELMIAVAKAESGLDRYATHKNTNGTRDVGILQVNSVHGYDDLEMFDVDKNLKAAREVYDKQGIGAWYGFSNGGYKRYMK